MLNRHLDYRLEVLSLILWLDNLVHSLLNLLSLLILISDLELLLGLLVLHLAVVKLQSSVWVIDAGGTCERVDDDVARGVEFERSELL